MPALRGMVPLFLQSRRRCTGETLVSRFWGLFNLTLKVRGETEMEESEPKVWYDNMLFLSRDCDPSPFRLLVSDTTPTHLCVYEYPWGRNRRISTSHYDRPGSACMTGLLVAA